MSQRGRKRLAVCRAGLHVLTNENRRVKIYITKNGDEHHLSNGCRICASVRDNARSARNYVPVLQTRQIDDDAEMDRKALRMLGREA